MARMHSSNIIPSHYDRVLSVVHLELDTPRMSEVVRSKELLMKHACFPAVAAVE